MLEQLSFLDDHFKLILHVFMGFISFLTWSEVTPWSCDLITRPRGTQMLIEWRSSSSVCLQFSLNQIRISIGSCGRWLESLHNQSTARLTDRLE